MPSLHGMTAASPQLSPPVEPRNRAVNLVYAAALTVAVANWFVAIRAPLWFDEGISYAQISAGFSQIYARAGGSFPGYAYILWAYTNLFGTSEVVLRIPSVVAMLAATYVLYRCARELFSRDAALVATTVFALHPVVVYAAIDIRQYAFAVLTVNVAGWLLLLWSRTERLRDALLFGAASALIFYFHTLFGLILLPFAAYLLLEKSDRLKILAPQVLAALGVFAVLMLPIIPRLFQVSSTREQHVFDRVPDATDLLLTIAPGHLALIFPGLLLLLAGNKTPADLIKRERVAATFPILLGTLPVAILYGMSVFTQFQVFVFRYRLVCVPGIALCWALMLSRLRSNFIMPAFCAAAVAVAMIGTTSPERSAHGYTWKYALEAAEANTTQDHAPLLICNDIPESNFAPLRPSATNDGDFAPLGYYKVTSPVVPLPRVWNVAAALQVRRFLSSVEPARQRFLVLAFEGSWPSLNWIEGMTKKSYTPKLIGTYDGVRVVEFRPND